MNYQFAVNGDGDQGLDSRYKRLCGFLKKCTPSELPFDVNAEKQGNPHGEDLRNLKSCALTDKMSLYANEFHAGVMSGRVCGQPLKEAFKDYLR